MTIVAPLVELGVLALVLWVVATALAIALIMRVIGDVFRHIPVVGGYIAGAVEAVAQAISNACGKLEHGVDKLIGASWHLLARYMDHLWHQIETQAATLLNIVEIAVGLSHAHVHLRAIVHKAVGAVGHIVPRVKTLEKEWHGIEHRVKTLEREWTRGIGHDLRIHVKALEHELHRIRSRVIPGIRSTADSAEAKAESALDWTRGHAYLPNVRTLEAAGVAILAAVGLNWLRCDSNPFNRNKNACGLWGDLAELLGLATAAVAIYEFDALMRETQALADDAIQIIEDVFSVGS